MKLRKRNIAVILGCVLATPTTWAGNSPEPALKNTIENILPKVNDVCGTQITLEYDIPSLKQNNREIGLDQTDGADECNEPLRYMWYACQTEEGKKQVQSRKIAKVQCTGGKGSMGRLFIQGNTLIVERANEEAEDFLRSTPQFERLFKLKLELAEPDPYYDNTWKELPSLPNPDLVNGTAKDYCEILGNRERFSWNAGLRGARSGPVKCIKDGVVITDLKIVEGRRTGFETYETSGGRVRSIYVDGRRHGESKEFNQQGQHIGSTFYDNEQIAATKSFFPDGSLKEYWRKYPNGRVTVRYSESRQVTSLDCNPAAGNDADINKICGFGQASTVAIYDGTGKISKTVTYKDGVLQSQSAGDSRYADASTVEYRNGKKHGEETVMSRKGKLAATIIWNNGVKDGVQKEYAEDGVRLIREIHWKNGTVLKREERYLNGGLKFQEILDGEKNKQERHYWDSGKVSLEGSFIRCGRRGEEWCKQGEHRQYHEDGTPATLETFQQDRLEGLSRVWDKTGQLREERSYTNDRVEKLKEWDEKGNILKDKEFEEDGSVKLR